MTCVRTSPEVIRAALGRNISEKGAEPYKVFISPLGDHMTMLCILQTFLKVGASTHNNPSRITVICCT